jgi:hypothetical protein
MCDESIIYYADMEWLPDTGSPDQRGEAQPAHSGPPETVHECCEAAIPHGSPTRNWTLRNDNYGHHSGVVILSESPLYLDLSWRRTAFDSRHRVGVFRLNLQQLLVSGYISTDPSDPSGSSVRLRIVRADDEHFYVQADDSGPREFLA